MEEDKINLEAIKEKLAREGYQESTPRPIPQEQKRELIQNWNNKPEIRENNIRAVDLDDFKVISMRFYKILWWIIIFLFIISAIFLYRTIYPENFRDAITTILNNTVNLPSIHTNITNIINPPTQNIINNINITLPEININVNST